MKREMVLRNRLKEARKQNKLSQEELAKMVGVARNTITSIERGEYSPSAYLAWLLVEALGKEKWPFEKLFYMEFVDKK